MKIEVKTCNHCPFIARDKETGEEWCSEHLSAELPKNKIPDWCPLRKESITIELVHYDKNK